MMVFNEEKMLATIVRRRENNCFVYKELNHQGEGESLEKDSTTNREITYRL